MTDKRLVTDAEADEISEVSDGFGVRALLDTRERCIEALERLEDAVSWYGIGRSKPRPSNAILAKGDAIFPELHAVRNLLRELHGEGEGE